MSRRTMIIIGVVVIVLVVLLGFCHRRGRSSQSHNANTPATQTTNQ